MLTGLIMLTIHSAYLSEAIMLYTLNIYKFCQLYLLKLGKNEQESAHEGHCIPYEFGFHPISKWNEIKGF